MVYASCLDYMYRHECSHAYMGCAQVGVEYYDMCTCTPSQMLILRIIFFLS